MIQHLWTYNQLPFSQPTPDIVGFVYIITNLLTNRRYIGKKNFWGTKTSQKTVIIKSTGLKKKKKIRTQIPSDWETYFGSNDELKKDVVTYGEHNFSREIIRLCRSKGEMSYMEARTQFELDVILHPDKFYNVWIMVRTHRSHLKDLVVKQEQDLNAST